MVDFNALRTTAQAGINNLTPTERLEMLNLYGSQFGDKLTGDRKTQFEKTLGALKDLNTKAGEDGDLKLTSAETTQFEEGMSNLRRESPLTVDKRIQDITGDDLSGAIRSGDTENLNRAYNRGTPEQIANWNTEMGGADGVKSQIDGMTGKTADYRAALKTAVDSGGERTSLDAGGVADFATKLQKADRGGDNRLLDGINTALGTKWGTDEAAVNSLQNLDDKSLMAVDAKLKANDPDTYPNGIQSLIDDNLSGNEKQLLNGRLENARTNVEAATTEDAKTTTATPENARTAAAGNAYEDFKKTDAFTNDYTVNGKYTAEPAEGEIGEGMNGKRVADYRAELEAAGYTNLTGKNDTGENTYWGPKMQKAHEDYTANNKQALGDRADPNVAATEGAGRTTAAETTGVRSAGGISFDPATGALKVESTGEQDIKAWRDGDNYNIQMFDKDGIVKDADGNPSTMTLSADDVKSADFLFKDKGGNRVFNGYKDADGNIHTGINGATIKPAGQNNAIINYADDVNIDLSNTTSDGGDKNTGNLVNSYGNNVTIKDSSRARDQIYAEGKDLNVQAGYGDSVAGKYEGGTIASRGGAKFNVEGQGLRVDAESDGRSYEGMMPDTGNVVGDGNVVFADENDQGKVIGDSAIANRRAGYVASTRGNREQDEMQARYLGGQTAQESVDAEARESQANVIPPEYLIEKETKPATTEEPPAGTNKSTPSGNDGGPTTILV